MSKRGLGLLPDKAAYALPLCSVAYTPDKPKEYFGLIKKVKFGLDQQDTNTCVAFDFAQQMWILRREIVDIPFAYWLAKRRAGQDEGTDDGCVPTDLWAAAREVGYLPSNGYNPHPSTGFRGLAETCTALKHAELAISKAVGKGSIKDCLLAKRPVGIGLTVDRAFMDYQGWYPWRCGENVEGRHMVTAVAYEEDGLIVYSSWGTGWADGQLGLVSWDEEMEPCIVLE